MYSLPAFSIPARLTFLDKPFSVGGSCTMQCRMVSSISVLQSSSAAPTNTRAWAAYTACIYFPPAPSWRLDDSNQGASMAELLVKTPFLPQTCPSSHVASHGSSSHKGTNLFIGVHDHITSHRPHLWVHMKDICEHVNFGETCLVHSNPLGASSTPPPVVTIMSPDNAKCPQEGKSLPVGNHCFERLTLCWQRQVI